MKKETFIFINEVVHNLHGLVEGIVGLLFYLLLSPILYPLELLYKQGLKKKK